MKNLFNILFSLILINSISLFAEENSIDKCGIRFTATSEYPFVDATSPDAEIKKFHYNKNGKKIYVIQAFRRNKNPNEWEKFSIDITPSQDAIVNFSVTGLPDESKKSKTPKKLVTLIDNIKLNDVLIKNGDFENGLSSHSFTKNKILNIKLEQSPKHVKFGKKCASIWSQTYLTNRAEGKKDKVINYSLMTKPRGEIKRDYDALLDFAEHANTTPPYKADSNGEVIFDTIRFNAQKCIDFKKLIRLDVADKLYCGKYLYLLHSYEGLNESDGTDKARVIISTTDGKKSIAELHIGREILDTNAHKLAHNAKAVWFADVKNKKGAIYLSRFDINSEEPIKAIAFNTKKGGQWKIYGATISDKDIRPYECWTPTPDQWKPADIQKNNIVIKDSAIDQSHFFHSGEAGKFGRIVVSERGTFAFENLPEKDVRLKSFSLNSYQFRGSDKAKRYERLKEYAELIKRTGYNCVRIDFDFIRDPSVANKLDANMDMLDYFMAELKKNGIYIHYVLAWRDLGLKKTSKQYERDEMKMRCLFLEPEAVKGWQKWTTYLLNHVNPYTKLALKDDPQIVQVEYFNEFSIAIPRIERVPNHIKDYLYNSFRKWLKQKYNTIENLNNAWNTPGFYAKTGGAKFKNFDEVKDTVSHNHDWMIFAAQTRFEFFRICTDTVRKTGYKGIIASENMGGYPLAIPLRNRDFDSIVNNTYYSHPVGFDYTNTTCSQVSAIANAFPNISSFTYGHINDRPLGITEYNYCFWNQHRYETPATFPLYASFQNLSMLTIHEDAVPNRDLIEMKYRKEISPFRVENSPTLRASELLATSLFIRQDIKPSKPTVEIDMSKENLDALPSQIREFDDIQAKLGLLTGVRIKTYGKRPDVLKKVKITTPLYTIKPNCKNRNNTFGKWIEKVYNGNMGGSNLPQNIEKLRELGILDKSNKTNITKGIFHSDTKEILLDVKNKIVKVSTPKTELITGEVLKNQTSDNLKVVSSSIPATVAITSLDNKKIEKSKRLLFTYITQEANSGMEASFDQLYLVKMGKAPVLLKTGKLEAELKLDPSKTYKLYPLSLNGERRAEIPCDFKNGVLKICIDTHTLPNGPTTIFEIIVSNEK